jgi:shikimate dehydrogenase
MKHFLLGIISDRRAWRSLSPLMHRAALSGAGLRGDYIALAVNENDLAPAVAGLWALGFSGVNITVPYKQLVIPWLEALSPQAASVGAVNTLVRGKSGFVGHNTDVSGFQRAAGEMPGSIALVGAGGAARAALAALPNRRIDLLGRDPGKIRALTRELNAARAQGTGAVIAHAPLPSGFACDWLINATSASSPAESPQLAAWAKTLRPRRGVFDCNYGRADNFWQALAQRAQIPFQDGLNMLAFQARDSFQLWTGMDMPAEIFKQALS